MSEMSLDKDRFEDLVHRVQAAVEAQSRDDLDRALDGLHASDLADLLEALNTGEGHRVLRSVSRERASEAMAEMDEGDVRANLLASLEPSEGAQLVQQLPDDDAADLVGELEPDERAAILAALPDEDAGEIRDLLEYDEETAGGLMTTAVVSVDASLRAMDAIEAVRRQGREVEDFYSVFVVGERGKLLGTLGLDALVVADPETEIAALVEPTPISVLPGTDQEEVGRLLSRYNLVSVPVVNGRGALLGRVTFDDVIDVLEAEQTEDILKLAGVREEETVKGGWGAAVRARLPWLFLNLLTATLAASVILHYEEMIARYTALAFLAPIIAAMGGNAGTQSLAVTLRRLTLEGAELGGKPWRAVGKELLVGLVNGAALGSVAALVGWAFAGIPEFGLVVFFAMWGNQIAAGFAGAFVPTLLSRIGVDPAVASSVFVHTTTDLIGFVLLLGLASSMLL